MVGRGFAGSAIGLGVVASCALGDVNDRSQAAVAQRLVTTPQVTVSEGLTLGTGALTNERPAIATDGDGFFVLWVEPSTIVGTTSKLRGTRVSADGVPDDALGKVLVEDTISGWHPVSATYAAGHYVVSWVGPGPDQTAPFGIWAATLDASGQATLGKTFLLPADATDGPLQNVLVSDGERVVALASGYPEYTLELSAVELAPGAAPVATSSASPARLFGCYRCGAGPEYEMCDAECTQVQGVGTGTRWLWAADSGDEITLTQYQRHITVGAFITLGSPGGTRSQYVSPFRRPDPNDYYQLGMMDPAMSLTMARGDASTLVMHNAGELEPADDPIPGSWYEAQIKTRGHAILLFNADGELVSDTFHPDSNELERRAVAFAGGYFVALDRVCQKDLAEVGLALMREDAPPGFEYLPTSGACVTTQFTQKPAFVGNDQGQLLAAYPRGDNQVEIRAISGFEPRGSGGGGAGGGGGEAGYPSGDAGAAGAPPVVGNGGATGIPAGGSGMTEPPGGGGQAQAGEPGVTGTAGEPAQGGAVSAGSGGSAGSTSGGRKGGHTGGGGDGGCSLSGGRNSNTLSTLVALLALLWRRRRDA